jgi:uncharacterized protein (DUF1800 family)
MSGPIVSRRRVLGAAAASGAAVASIRLLGAGKDLLAGAGRGDWDSPLGSEKARVAQLLRRATFGSSLEELEKAASDGYRRTLDRLLESPPERPPPLPAASQPGQPVRVSAGQLQLWWVSHMLQTSTPLAERMTLFWHGHFTSDYRKVSLRTPFIYWQNLTWRDMGLGDLRSMLMRVTTDPAMLRYLDLSTSTGRNPNENYARELMELFTVGAGNFEEGDVRAAARALAGWVEPPRDSAFETPVSGRFVPGRAYQGGPLTFLGRRAVFDTDKVIDQILAQPATAVFIARKVVQHFVGARVEESYVRRLGDGFRASKYDVRSLMRAVLSSPEFTAQQSYRALVKDPVEMMVHTLKALGATGLGRLVPQFGAGMGQALFDPPDVAGWPSNQAWISSQSVIARVNFVSAALQQARALPAGGQALAHLDGVVGAQTAGLLNRSRDDHARWFGVLASPEFQLK